MSFMKAIVNPAVLLILRSPLHGLVSASLLAITYKGRKSGGKYILPVQYARDNDRIFVVPGQPEQKTWWRNFKGGLSVELTLRGKTLSGYGYLLDRENDLKAINDGLEAYLRRFPALAKYYQIRTAEDGKFISEDIRKATETALIICVTLNERIEK
jgi:hypothetical protein